MEILKSYTEAKERHSFHAVTRYTYNVDPIEFWSKILSLQDKHNT